MNTDRFGCDKAFAVVVGIDGSRPSLAALSTACALADARGGVVHALRALTFDSIALLDIPLDLHEAHEQLRAACQERAAGVAHVVTHVALDRPEHALEQLARELDADVIVVGTRRRGAFQTLLHGSVTERLVRDAHCPVLIVHDDDDVGALRIPPRDAQVRHTM